MKFTNPLDKILNQETKVKILRFFVKTCAEWTGRQIAKEISVSPATCHKALRELNYEGILSFRTVGVSYLYKLNVKNHLVKKVLYPLFKEENNTFKSLKNILSRYLKEFVPKNIVSVTVFGSLSKKKDNAKSDIDVLLLVRKVKDKSIVEKKIKTVSSMIMEEYGNSLSSYIQTISEFKKKNKNGLPLIKGILKSGTIIMGKPPSEVI